MLRKVEIAGRGLGRGLETGREGIEGRKTSFGEERKSNPNTHGNKHTHAHFGEGERKRKKGSRHRVDGREGGVLVRAAEWGCGGGKVSGGARVDVLVGVSVDVVESEGAIAVCSLSLSFPPSVQSFCSPSANLSYLLPCCSSSSLQLSTNGNGRLEHAHQRTAHACAPVHIIHWDSHAVAPC